MEAKDTKVFTYTYKGKNEKQVANKGLTKEQLNKIKTIRDKYINTTNKQ